MPPKFFQTPFVTPARRRAAFAVAILTDGLQWALGPLGWIFIDQILDVIAMILTCWLLGFHLLLLPTFILEFLPLTDLLPTWTGCVAWVVSIRKRKQAAVPPRETVTVETSHL